MSGILHLEKEMDEQLLRKKDLGKAHNDLFDPKSDPPTAAKMVSLLCKLSIPSISTNLLGYLSNVINLVLAGRMNDTTKLAAVGLANVCHAVMIFHIMIGLNAA